MESIETPPNLPLRVSDMALSIRGDIKFDKVGDFGCMGLPTPYAHCVFCSAAISCKSWPTCAENKIINIITVY